MNEIRVSWPRVGMNSASITKDETSCEGVFYEYLDYPYNCFGVAGATRIPDPGSLHELFTVEPG
jgi:hypothetical protein